MRGRSGIGSGGNCGGIRAAGCGRRFAGDVLLGSKIAISQIKLGKNLSWLAIVPHLSCDSLKCASNSLVGADKPPQESQDVDNDDYDASDIDQNK